MKEIKLFVSVKLTSLSPDAQVISLGIVSDDLLPDGLKISHYTDDSGNVGDISKIEDSPMYNGIYHKIFKDEFSKSKSFYAEFTDLNINRCDEWVKENVVGKLMMYGKPEDEIIESLDYAKYQVLSITQGVKIHLKEWLKQFSDYQIQFVADCGTFDFYHLLQLIAEWDEVENEEGWSRHCPTCGTKGVMSFKIGLPKLPSNISPIAFDLNDLIAFKKEISVKEAFELDREEMALGHHSEGLMKRMKILDNVAENELARNPIKGNKHNSLWDAKVIKSIYEKLM